jgi:hypothetical protein
VGGVCTAEAATYPWPAFSGPSLPYAGRDLGRSAAAKDGRFLRNRHTTMSFVFSLDRS